jgi:hypothetical protein
VKVGGFNIELNGRRLTDLVITELFRRTFIFRMKRLLTVLQIYVKLQVKAKLSFLS